MSAPSPGPVPGGQFGPRTRQVTAMVLVIAGLAFVGGIVVGTSVSRPAEGSSSKPSVIDQAAQRIAAQAAKPIDQATLDQAAVQGMLRALGDRWSAYYTPSQYDSFTQALQGRYTGVGLWIGPGTGGSVVVSSVQSGSPAATAGLASGEALVAVAGHPVEGQALSTVAGWLRGPAGTTVRVTVREAGQPLTDAVLTRRDITTDSVTVDRLAGSVMSIRITSFTRGVGAQVRSVLAADAPSYSGGIVLDLRDDPGGLVSEAVQVVGAFVHGGVVVSYQQRGSAPQVLDATGNGDSSTPLVVLVDGNTASAAEIVAGALQDRGRAVVIGSQTYGKGSVQEPSTLSDGSAIEFTIGRYYTPSGRSIDGVGITPDVLLPAQSDPDLAEQRSLVVLHGLAVALGSESH